MKKLSLKQDRLLFAVVLILYILSVLVITIGARSYDNETAINLIPLNSYKKMFAPVIDGLIANGMRGALDRLKWVDYASRSSVVLNIFLFVPFGYLCPLCIKKLDMWHKILLVGIGFSVFIEFTQLITHRGWFDVDDIIHNGLGTFIGWLCYRRWLRPLYKQEQ